ncbi:MAG: murein biosynthesis integral membrane protein MurJ [Bacillota bacterium]|nr:murein biosynthesis integral membrane protein MurJ [Bacillota bacterium]
MKSVAKSIGIVTFIMLLSRSLSMLSSSFYASKFGTTIGMEIYSFALQVPLIIFTSLGTALVTVIIPIFAGYLTTGEKDRAFKFVDKVITITIVFTLALSFLCVLATPLITLLIPKFRSQDYGLTVFALRVMFPIMIFYAMNYIFQGILQSFGKFNMPAVVSIPSSVIVILYSLLLSKSFGVRGLIIATFIGLTTQALILIPPIFKTEYRYHPSLVFKDADIITAAKLVPPVLLGTSAYSINMLFNNVFASRFERNTVFMMNWVQNLVLYAILAFVYSVTAVVFPKFTQLAAKKDMEGFKTTLIKILSSIAYILIPCTAGFIAVRFQLIELLIKWGKIQQNDVNFAAQLMALYCIGIIGFGVKEVVDRAFYSLKDTLKPAINGIIMMAINITVSLILSRFIGVYGIPLAYSVSSLSGSIILMFLIRKKIGTLGLKNLMLNVTKIVCSSLLMFAVVISSNMLIKRFNFGFFLLDRTIKLIIPVTIGCAIYFLLTYLFRVEEANDTLDKIRTKFFTKKAA